MWTALVTLWLVASAPLGMLTGRWLRHCRERLK